MIQARLFLGQGGGNNLREQAVGAFEDDGEPYDILAASAPVPPAGIEGEAIFTRCWLAVTHTMAVTLRFRFFVDDREMDSQDVDLEAQDEPTVRILEFALSEAILGPTAEEAVRNAPRGAIFVVQIETVDGIGEGALQIEGRGLETEVVRESRAAEAVA